MNNENYKDDWKQRMYELEEENKYYKLKRREKNELKELHKYQNIIKIKKEEEKEIEKEKEKEKKKRITKGNKYETI